MSRITENRTGIAFTLEAIISSMKLETIYSKDIRHFHENNQIRGRYTDGI